MASVGGETKSEGLIDRLDNLLAMQNEALEMVEELVGPPLPLAQRDQDAKGADDSYSGRVNNRVEEARSRADMLLRQLGRLVKWF